MRPLPLLALLLLGGCRPALRPEPAEELLVCGGDEVVAVDLSGRTLWSWKATERPEIPPELRPKFRSTDDCKPVDGGAKVLITSSGGAVALVERATGRALFWAAAVNAHSAELLPRGRVAVASSVGTGGNRLLLFDLAAPGAAPLWQEELSSAHGAVWDDVRRTLWALGGRELRAYRLKDWDGPAPSLERAETFPLPDVGGHELRPVPGRPALLVTTHTGVWHFDRDRARFDPADGFPEKDDVKAVDVHPGTGRIAWVRAEESWWAFRIRFLNPPGELALPGRRIYKARWVHR
jgi:hypothetical protein